MYCRGGTRGTCIWSTTDLPPRTHDPDFMSTACATHVCAICMERWHAQHGIWMYKLRTGERHVRLGVLLRRPHTDFLISILGSISLLFLYPAFVGLCSRCKAHACAIRRDPTLPALSGKKGQKSAQQRETCRLSRCVAYV